MSRIHEPHPWCLYWWHVPGSQREVRVTLGRRRRRPSGAQAQTQPTEYAPPPFVPGATSWTTGDAIRIHAGAVVISICAVVSATSEEDAREQVLSAYPAGVRSTLAWRHVCPYAEEMGAFSA